MVDLWLWLEVQRHTHRGCWLAQGLVEYAFLILFVGVVLIALLVILGPGIAEVFENIVEIL